MKDTYDSVAEKYDEFFSTEKYKKEDFEVAQKLPKLKGKILDIGCGTGLVIDLYKMVGEPNIDYVGVDPSFNMLKKLILKFGDKKCFCCKFEELPGCEKYDTIVSIYNSPSYIKPSRIKDIKKIAKPGADVFLMFAKDGYTPIAHSLAKNEIPIYEYSKFKKHLKRLSKNFSYEEFNNYVIVSGKI